MKNKISVTKLLICCYSVIAMQVDEAAPYFNVRSRESSSVTSQLLGTRTYNAEGQLVSEGDSAGKLTSYTYNASGQVITTQDRNGNFIHNIYNDHVQLQTSWADQSATSTTPGVSATDMLTPSYDSGSDQLTGSTYQQNQSAPQQITGEQYNLAGELSAKRYGPSPASGKGSKSKSLLEQQYQYNLNGSTKSFTNVLKQVTNYTYTPMNQLSTVNFNGGTTTTTYDAFGRLSNETRPNGVQTNWTYDDYNGMETIQNKNTSGTINQLGYTYYADGNIHTETPSPGTTYKYLYNHLNQLTNFTCTGGSCPKDSHGKTITNSTYTYTLNNGIQSIASNGNTATYNYYAQHPDRLQNITNSDNNYNQSGTYIYDNNGNVTTNASGHNLTYDALNQMLSIKKSSGPLIESYGYDGAGKVNQETATNQPTINEYYGGNGKAVTTKIQGASATSYAMGTDRIAQYYFANDPLTTPTSTQYYLYDQRGSVTNVVNTSSNTGYVYSPFGYLSTTGSPKKKSTPPSLANNTFGYIGQSLNPTTGLMMMGGYRAYDPAVGNFLKQDSYSPFQGAGTFNGYDYGAGNPILFIDPTGHMPWFDWLFIGIAVGAAAGLGFYVGGALAVGAVGAVGAAGAGADVAVGAGAGADVAVGAGAGADVAVVGAGAGADVAVGAGAGADVPMGDIYIWESDSEDAGFRDDPQWLEYEAERLARGLPAGTEGGDADEEYNVAVARRWGFREYEGRSSESFLRVRFDNLPDGSDVDIYSTDVDPITLEPFADGQEVVGHRSTGGIPHVFGRNSMWRLLLTRAEANECPLCRTPIIDYDGDGRSFTRSWFHATVRLLSDD